MTNALGNGPSLSRRTAAPLRAARARSAPFILGVTDDAILAALAQYYYLTALQVTRLLVSRGALTRVQTKLKRLTDAGYLQRLYLPRPSQSGKAPSIYTLARRGLNYLMASERATNPRYHPVEQTELSYLFLSHTLAVNDFLIGARLLTRQLPDVVLNDSRHERELKREPVHVTITEGPHHTPTKLAVIPDGWLQFHVHAAAETGVVLELDRGHIEQKRWRRRVAALLAYARGPYEEQFHTPAITIAVLATPGEKRATDLLRWTEAELTARGETAEADLFRFTGLPPDSDPLALYTVPTWLRPFDPRPVPLIEGVRG